MSRHYSNPKRESDPWALPDIETWEVDAATDPEECPGCSDTTRFGADEETEEDREQFHLSNCRGWWWRSGFPGCLPDGEAQGPYETEAEALADAREGLDDDESEEE